MSEIEDRVKKAITAGFKMPIHEAHDPHRWLAKCAIEAMREPLLAIIAKEEQDFLSPEYATGQPLSSFSERFACREVAKAIAAALSSSEPSQ